VCLENVDFRNLRQKALKNNVKLGGDFLIYSDLKIFKDDYLKKTILIRKV